jgi:site-specific recombinase XerC
MPAGRARPGLLHGRRDHALLVLACQTGLRVSELSGCAAKMCT